MSGPILLGVAPSCPVQRQLLALQRRLATEIGLRPARDELHATLFVNSFMSVADVRAAVRLVTDQHDAFLVRGRGLRSFGYDELLHGLPVVWSLERDPRLVALQADLFAHLAPLRTSEQEDFIASTWTTMSRHQRHDLHAYGYPYCPRDWRYHVTLGCHDVRLPPRTATLPDTLDVDRVSVFRWRRNRFRYWRSHRLGGTR